MTAIRFITLVLFAISAGAAIAVARRDERHRPVAAYIATVLAVDIGRLIVAQLLPPAAPASPYTGTLRALWHVEQSAYLGSILALPAMFMALFLRRRPWLIGGIWLISAVLLAALYPGVRGAALLRVYSAAELAAALACVGFFVTWLASGRVSEDGVTVSVICATTLLGAHLMVAVMPQLGGAKTLITWPVVVATHAIITAIVLVLQLRVLWKNGEKTT